MALDAALGRTLEGEVHHFHVENLAEAGQVLVGAVPDLDGDFLLLLLIRSHHGIGVRVYQRDNLPVACQHHGLFHQRVVRENLLHFFGVDVLAGRIQDEGFDAAADEEVPAFIHHAQVSGAEPAVRGAGGFVGLGVLVIARIEVGAAELDFSRYTLRVRGIDADFVDGFAAGAGHVAGWRFDGQQGTGFRHAVGYHIRQANLSEGYFHFPVQGRSADEDGANGAAQVPQHFFADGFVEGHPHAGHGTEHLAGTAVQFRPHPAGIDFFHHHGNGDHIGGVLLLHGFHQMGGGRRFPQETDPVTGAAGVKEFHHQAVTVGQREHGDHALRLVRDVFLKTSLSGSSPPTSSM